MKTVKQLRVEHGLTQEQIAELFGVSSKTIFNIEKDSSNIRDQLLSKYMKAFGVKYDDIFLGDKYEIFEFEKESENELLVKIKRAVSV